VDLPRDAFGVSSSSRLLLFGSEGCALGRLASTGVFKASLGLGRGEGVSFCSTGDRFGYLECVCCRFRLVVVSTRIREAESTSMPSSPLGHSLTRLRPAKEWPLELKRFAVQGYGFITLDRFFAHVISAGIDLSAIHTRRPRATGAAGLTVPRFVSMVCVLV